MPTPLKPRPLRLRFHAVTIISGPTACAQARAIKDVRLLSPEAPPRLPLVGCTNADGCQCRFQHHTDRRAGPRRSELRSAKHGLVAKEDSRRRLPGRRDSDYLDN
jgi:hypothetical protein